MVIRGPSGIFWSTIREVKNLMTLSFKETVTKVLQMVIRGPSGTFWSTIREVKKSHDTILLKRQLQKC